MSVEKDVRAHVAGRPNLVGSKLTEGVLKKKVKMGEHQGEFLQFNYSKLSFISHPQNKGSVCQTTA